MNVIGMHEAKTGLSQLVKRVTAGETIFIGAYGKASVKLVPAHPSEAKPAKRIGVLVGQLDIPDDFDSPLPDEVLASFEGGSAA